MFATYAALYWHHTIAAAMPFDARFSYFVASCSAICMALGLLLSARPRAIETAFGGLDRMYRLHKYLGVAALLLFIAHFATVPGGPEEEAARAVGAATVEGSAAAPTPAEAVGADEEEGLLPTLWVRTRASSRMLEGPLQEHPDQIAFFWPPRRPLPGDERPARSPVVGGSIASASAWIRGCLRVRSGECGHAV